MAETTRETTIDQEQPKAAPFFSVKEEQYVPNQKSEEDSDIEAKTPGTLERFCIQMFQKIEELERGTKMQAEFNRETYSAVSSMSIQCNAIAASVIKGGAISEQEMEELFQAELVKYSEGIKRIEKERASKSKEMGARKCGGSCNGGHKHD